MHYEFRPFSIEKDGELVKAFLLDTQKVSGTIPDDIQQDGAAYIAAILSAQERDPASCAMLVENGSVVGFIDVQVSKKNPKNGFIRFDYIIPQKRRSGLGGKLITYAFERLRNAGCEKVCLDVVQSNLPAIAFYEKHGWIFSDETKAPFRRMCKAL